MAKAAFARAMASDLFEKGRQLADAWARNCEGGKVIDFPVEVGSA